MFATKQETTDLFGMPIHIDTSERIVRHREKKLHDRLANSINLVLFVELLDQLKAPLFKAKAAIPEEYRSDIAGVRLTEEAESEIAEVTDESHDDAIAIPYEAWGTPEVIDDKGLAWSHEGLIFLQVRLFWRSMEELALSNNEGEKWSVLRWIFRPAYWHYYSYDKRIGRSHRLRVVVTANTNMVEDDSGNYGTASSHDTSVLERLFPVEVKYPTDSTERKILEPSRFPLFNGVSSQTSFKRSDLTKSFSCVGANRLAVGYQRLVKR